MNMKKQYIKPSMEVVEIKINQQLLTVSDPGYGGGGNADPQAPGFDWVEKAYEFGGWDLETE